MAENNEERTKRFITRALKNFLEFNTGHLELLIVLCNFDVMSSRLYLHL